MGTVPPRQVAILSIANDEEILDALGVAAMAESMEALREFAILCGVEREHMRTFRSNTLLLRLDELPREVFLRAVKLMAQNADTLVVPGEPSVKLKVRVGAMSERALRSFVNDAAADLLAYMNHMDSRATLLAGDELDLWQQLKCTDIEFLSHEQLKNLDPFTGLLKIERFLELLGEVLQNQDRYGSGVSVLYLDIEDFKSYNRAFDYEQGNELLLFVANEIKKAFSSDTVAHVWVDRYAVLTNSPDIARKCSVIHEATKAYRKSFSPEIKCGIFRLEKAVSSPHIALDCAKLACESIKGHYDVSFRFFDDELKDQLFTRRYVAHHAEQAVAEHWIHAYAQTVVDTTTGEPCGFEALARWEDPERGILSPAVFIPTLEEAHLIHKVDAFMVDEVCRHLAERMEQGKQIIPASVNLSRLDFKLCDVLAAVEESCDRWGIPRHLLALEITESALDSQLTLHTEMDRFRAAGFEVWMDDFGCGYSSLNLLKDYDFDVLKVDMEFLRDMEGNQRSKTIVQSVIDMAKSLGIRTLVEGVETRSQRDFLRAAGCDMMQGYLFSKPIPLEGGDF